MDWLLSVPSAWPFAKGLLRLLKLAKQTKRNPTNNWKMSLQPLQHPILKYCSGLFRRKEYYQRVISWHAACPSCITRLRRVLVLQLTPIRQTRMFSCVFMGSPEPEREAALLKCQERLHEEIYEMQTLPFDICSLMHELLCTVMILTLGLVLEVVSEL